MSVSSITVEQILAAPDYSEELEGAIGVADLWMQQKRDDDLWEWLEFALGRETLSTMKVAPWTVAQMARFIVARHRLGEQFTAAKVATMLPKKHRALPLIPEALNQLMHAGLIKLIVTGPTCPHCGGSLATPSKSKALAPVQPLAPKSKVRRETTLAVAKQLLAEKRVLSAREVARRVGHGDDKTARNDLDALAALGLIPPRPRKIAPDQTYQLTQAGEDLAREIVPIMSQGDKGVGYFMASAVGR